MKLKFVQKLLSAVAAVVITMLSSAVYADLDLGEDNWRWGEDDAIGAGNLITASSIKAALADVNNGEVVELSYDVAMGAPHIWPLQTPYIMTMSRTSKNVNKFLSEHMGATNDIGFYLERIEMTTHVSTHIDALGHVTVAAEFYNGVSIADGESDEGLTRFGIEKTPPFIARGILIDIAAYKGVETLEAGYAVTPADMEGALKKQGTTIPEGSIVFIHTGWGKYFTSKPQQYAHTGPGLGLAGSKWLAAKKVVAIGADNMALEVVPGEDPKVVFPVHQHLLAKQGIYIIENAKTDELAAKKLYETTTVMLPTKFRGATGTPLRIIAIH